MRVLYVSKPIVPPWNDGSKNLVRDLAAHLVKARATTMTEPGKARMLGRLLRDRDHDLWHFVFAPNPASSYAARLARVRFRGPVIQTVASRPRRVARSLFFGDIVVALSDWSKWQYTPLGLDVRVIPPCAPKHEVTDARVRAIRDALGVGDAPIFLYPGDYEFSSGARTVAEAAPAIARAVPEARVVFACRMKTERAAAARDALLSGRAKDAKYMVFADEVSDMPALLAASKVILFPVDDLYGKVDLPLVLLEALALGVPMVLAKGGPLEAISTARFVSPGEPEALAREALRASPDEGRAGVGLWKERFTPERVAARHDDLYEEALRAKSTRSRT